MPGAIRGDNQEEIPGFVYPILLHQSSHENAEEFTVARSFALNGHTVIAT